MSLEHDIKRALANPTLYRLQYSSLLADPSLYRLQHSSLLADPSLYRLQHSSLLADPSLYRLQHSCPVFICFPHLAVIQHLLVYISLLQVLWLSGNPVEQQADYRATVIQMFPQLESLDDSGSHLVHTSLLAVHYNNTYVIDTVAEYVDVYTNIFLSQRDVFF